MENLAVNSSVVLVGAGNLATSLGVALAATGVPPKAVWSRTMTSAAALGERIGCPAYCRIGDLPAADIFIISVADDALPAVAREVVTYFPAAIIAHTAGSVPMDILRSVGAVKYGVFYPMQTFSKQRVVSFENITIFVEGCNDDVSARLMDLASLITPKVVQATSEQRGYLHIAAVFACNFTNAAYQMAAALLEEHDLPFDAMLPLIDETAAKVHALHPRDAQTGPARRGDVAVMNAHKAMLAAPLRGIYAAMSDYISCANEEQ